MDRTPNTEAAEKRGEEPTPTALKPEPRKVGPAEKTEAPPMGAEEERTEAERTAIRLFVREAAEAARREAVRRRIWAEAFIMFLPPVYRRIYLA